MQALEKRVDFSFDAGGFYRWERRLEIAYDLADGALAVAMLQDFPAGTDEAQHAFGDQQNIALLRGFAQAASRAEPRPAFGRELAHAPSMRKAPGGGQPGFTYAK